MPETNVLYSVTAAVVVGLVAWVAVVLKSAKQPWGRAVPPAPRAADVPLEGEATEATEATEAPKSDDAKLDAEAKSDVEAKPAAEASADAAKTDAAER